MKNLKLLTWVMIVGIITACSGSDGRGFTKTESGIQYKVHVKGDGPQVQLENILSMDMVYRLADSVVFDSKLSGMPMYLQLTEPEFPGDIYEALALMSVGDSTTFMLDAEKFFVETAGMFELPEFVTSGDILYFDVKMNAAMDEEGFAAEQEKIMEQRMADAQKREQDEGSILDQYLLDNNIQVEARASGLYYVEKEKGSGPKVEAGQTVSVHYEGRLLDGTVFDSSLERDAPLDFVVGAGQVIPGWDEGIGLMNVGGKATLIIPSFLGYGERGAGQIIPPFSSLVFEVEVVDAK